MVDFLSEAQVCLSTLLSRLSGMQTNDPFRAQSIISKLFLLKAELSEELDEQQWWLSTYQKQE